MEQKYTAERKSRNLVEINSSCISREENTLKQITTHTLSTQTQTHNSVVRPLPLVFRKKHANFNSKTKKITTQTNTQTPSKGGGDVKILLFRPTPKCKHKIS